MNITQTNQTNDKFPACQIGSHKICAGSTFGGSDHNPHDLVCDCECHKIDWNDVSNELMERL